MKPIFFLLLSIIFSGAVLAQSGEGTNTQKEIINPDSDVKPSPIRRTLYFKFKPEVTAEDIEYVRSTFKGLRDKIDGMTEAIWMVSPDKAETFTHFLMLEFESEEALGIYDEHPDHKAIAEKGPSLIAGLYMKDYLVE